jgi:hypothetical protein
VIEQPLRLTRLAPLMRELDRAERDFLVACGWIHDPTHGWLHPIHAPRRPLTQWDAVMEARRRVMRDVLLRAAGQEHG